MGGLIASGGIDDHLHSDIQPVYLFASLIFRLI